MAEDSLLHKLHQYQYRIEYYERIAEVCNKDNDEQWEKLLLQAFYEAAKDANEARWKPLLFMI